ncbi:MAG: SdrD B-like domain-containing protein [Chloroflexota bacterium]
MRTHSKRTFSKSTDARVGVLAQQHQSRITIMQMSIVLMLIGLLLLIYNLFGYGIVYAGSSADFGTLPGTPADASYVAWVANANPPSQIITENSFSPGSGSGNGYSNSQWVLSGQSFQPAAVAGQSIDIIFGGQGAVEGTSWSFSINPYETGNAVTNHGAVGNQLTEGRCVEATWAQKIDDSTAVINWTGVADFYHVYRSVNESGASPNNGFSNGRFDLVAVSPNNTTTGIAGVPLGVNSFTDTTVSAGAGPWYIVVPADGAGNVIGCGSDELIAAATAPADSDLDGILDPDEVALGTNPGDGDTDGDGTCDGAVNVPEVCVAGENALQGQDTDNDGVIDALEEEDGVHNAIDPNGDEDGDGIINSTECPNGEPYEAPNCPDTDTDGTIDMLDNDDDGDTILTIFEVYDGNTDPTQEDSDNDNTPDYLDDDDDNDNVPTANENPDPNNDGNPDDAQDADNDNTPDYLDDTDDRLTQDDDNDGVINSVECPAGPPYDLATCPDTDNDGTPNPADNDDDGDTILTQDEAYGGNSDPTQQQSDADGTPDYLDDDDDDDTILTIFEVYDDNTDPTQEDSDADNTPDYLDSDDDGDNVLTRDENPDPNNDGNPDDAQDEDNDNTPDYLDDTDDRLTADDDNDGVNNSTECPAGPPYDLATCPDTDNDNTPDPLDNDDDGDGVLTQFEAYDGNTDPTQQQSDGDGTPDYLDDDDDDDNIDTINENADPNNDGNPDDAQDEDSDNIPDYLDDTDNRLTEDDDSDGILNNVECPNGPPYNLANCPDTDNDGTPDPADEDDDGDTILTKFEVYGGNTDPTQEDSDNDNTADYLDDDDDNDNVLTRDENPDPNGDGNPVDAQDIDNDTNPDYLDDVDNRPTNDDDGDGLNNEAECPAGPPYDLATCPDTDNDGTPDPGDDDDDGDTILTIFEAYDGNTDPTQEDSDNDNTPDYLDDDDDNDNILTRDENPDPNNDGNPDDAADSDSDNTPDYLDDTDNSGQNDDDDGDNLVNIVECPDGPPFNANNCPDSDGDGDPDFNDPDDDNDGTLTAGETGDADNDSRPDHLEPSNRDTDGDGNSDQNDADDDGDGTPTVEECGDNVCIDFDNDGIPSHLDPDNDNGNVDGGDSDGDGISDNAECPDGIPCPDGDNNGQPDYTQFAEPGFNFETYIDGQEADTLNEAVLATTGISLTLRYEVANTGNTQLNWRKLDDTVLGNLDDGCGLPRLIPVGNTVFCDVTIVAGDFPNGIEHAATARVVNALPGAGGGGLVLAASTFERLQEEEKSDSAWYQTNSLFGAIGDFVWEDENLDGIQDDNEPGLSGVQVELYDILGQLVETTVTDLNGFYRFTGVEAGSYRVGVVLPDLTTVYALKDQGDDDTKDSDANPSSGRTDPSTVSAGIYDEAADVGLVGLLSSKPSTIGGLAWEDVNGNGLRDDGEPLLPDVLVQLLDSSEQVLETTSTDPNNGTYVFTPLGPGNYFVRFIDPTGYEPTLPNQGFVDTIDSDVIPNDVGNAATTEMIELRVGETTTIWDAGYYRPVSLGDFIWEDLDGDGIQDNGEPGVSGATVTLYKTGVISPLLLMVTGSDGLYGFDGLIPGTYYIIVSNPAGTQFTAKEQGNDMAQDSDVNPFTGVSSPVTLNSGDSDDTLDAGLFTPAVIGDFIWNDLDADGVQENDEDGVENVTLNLLDSNGNVVGSTTTDANGAYSFDVNPGVYQVEIDIPAGYQLTFPDQGGDDATDSDFNKTTNRTPLTPVASGDTNNTLDGGLIQWNEGIDVEKSTNGMDADEPSGPQIPVGETVTWVFTVTNVGNIPLINITLNDDQLGDLTDTCPQTSLQPDESMVCTETGTAEEGLHRNVATVEGVDEFINSIVVEDTDVSHYTGIVVGADLTIAKMDSEDPADAGLELIYTLVYTNNGPGDAVNVQIEDMLPMGVLVNEIIMTNPPLPDPAASYNPATGLSVVWTVPQLNAGESGTIQFLVDTDPTLEGSTIENVATISSDTPDTNPDNNEAREETTFRIGGVGIPTAIELLSFTARASDDGIEVRWVTGAEVDTNGFSLYRSSNGNRDSAAAVTDRLIQSGGPLGSEYSFMDTSAVGGVTYTYWLVETENDGTEIDYGPVVEQAFTAGPTQTNFVFLPVVNR